MNIVGLLVLNLVTVHAVPGFNLPKPDCLLHKSAFSASPGGLKSLNLPVALMETAPKLELLDAQDRVIQQCTAAAVSDSGNLLTGGHCVDKCLATAGAYGTAEGFSKVDPAKVPSATCRFRLNGQPTVIEGKVLATSDCRMREKITTATACSGLDYALIKLNTPPNAACLRVSSTYPAAQTKIAAVGFTAETFRRAQKRDAQDSNGFDQQVSMGQTIAPTDSCHKDVDDPGLVGRLRGREAPGPVKFPKNYRTDFVMDRTRKQMMMQATADTYEGNSGGPAIDLQSGELTGIATIGIVSDRYVECKGGTFFTSTAAVIRDIRAQFPSVDLAKELGCRQRALLPVSK